MLSTLPISHDRTQIYYYGPNPVNEKNTAPNQMVSGESFFRKMRQLRAGTELLQKSLYEVRSSPAGEDEVSAQAGQLPITGRVKKAVSSEFVTKSSNSLKYSIQDVKLISGTLGPELRDRLMGKSPLRLIRERVEHPVPNSSSKYYVEALECGHSLTVHQPFFWDEGGHLFHSIPTAKRRRCQECRAIELALPPKKPVQSVKPKKEEAA